MSILEAASVARVDTQTAVRFMYGVPISLGLCDAIVATMNDGHRVQFLPLLSRAQRAEFGWPARVLAAAMISRPKTTP